jgi:hypothetical protein
MKQLRSLFVLVASLLGICSRDVRADTPPARTVFALIVTSNHGVSGAQPDLHYADDDGVKYLELFRMLAPEANVVLHTELDRDTERLYPWARSIVRAPTTFAISETIGTGYLTFGAVLGAAGGWLLTRPENSKNAEPYLPLGYGGLLVGVGGWSLLRTSAAEDLFQGYDLAIQSTDPSRRAMAVLGAERFLFALRRAAHTRRIWLRVAGFALAATAALAFSVNEVDATKKSEVCIGTGGASGSSLSCTSTSPLMSSDTIWAGRLTYGSLLALGTTVAVASFVPYPIERLANIWESDPGRVRGQEFRPGIAFAPVRGGGRLQVDWSF